MLDVAVKRCDSFDATYFSIENVVVGVDKLVNRFDSIDSILYLLACVSFRKGKAMKRNGLFYIVLNEKQIFTSIAISCPTIGRKL